MGGRTRKRGNGEGSIDKIFVGGKTYWRARWTDPNTKKQIGRGAKTRSEAQRILAEALTQIRTGMYSTPQRWTVGEWLDRWMQDIQMEPGTEVTRRMHIEKYIRPSLGMQA